MAFFKANTANRLREYLAKRRAVLDVVSPIPDDMENVEHINYTLFCRRNELDQLERAVLMEWGNHG